MDETAVARSTGGGAWHRVLLRRPGVVSGLAVVVAFAGIATAMGLGALATSRIPQSIEPQSMEIVGYAGHLGEWELTAKLSRSGPAAADLAGTMTMKHVGYCGKDGPEVKTGAMQVTLSRLTSSVAVKLFIDGIECTHTGDLSDASIGTMVCPQRKAVPLTLWKK